MGVAAGLKKNTNGRSVVGATYTGVKKSSS